LFVSRYYQLAAKYYFGYIECMVTVQDIETAIEHLPKDKLAEFRRWFEAFDAARWDKELEEDVQDGKLDALADQALKDLKEGRCSDL